MDTETPFHRNRSLEESAAIYAGGVEFVGLEARSHRSFYFCFRPAATADRLADEFRRGTLTVNARHFAACMKTLKDAIFSRLRNGDRDEYTAESP